MCVPRSSHRDITTLHAQAACLLQASWLRSATYRRVLEQLVLCRGIYYHACVHG
jgi:hypothetical protein